MSWASFFTGGRGGGYEDPVRTLNRNEERQARQNAARAQDARRAEGAQSARVRVGRTTRMQRNQQ